MKQTPPKPSGARAGVMLYSSSFFVCVCIVVCVGKVKGEVSVRVFCGCLSGPRWQRRDERMRDRVGRLVSGRLVMRAPSEPSRVQGEDG